MEPSGSRIERTQRSRPRPPARRCDQLVERTLAPLDVRVGDNQPAAVEAVGAEVGGAAVPEVATGAQQPGVRPLGLALRGAVRRAVVGEHELDRARSSPAATSRRRSRAPRRSCTSRRRRGSPRRPWHGRRRPAPGWAPGQPRGPHAARCPVPGGQSGGGGVKGGDHEVIASRQPRDACPPGPTLATVTQTRWAPGDGQDRREEPVARAVAREGAADVGALGVRVDVPAAPSTVTQR